jgi:hypothetical protein
MLAENPETRKDFLRMTKKVKPDLPIPELEMEDYTRKAVSQSEQRVQELEAKMRERDAVEELQKRRNNLVKKGLIQSEKRHRRSRKNHAGQENPLTMRLPRSIACLDETGSCSYFFWIQPLTCEAV